MDGTSSEAMANPLDEQPDLELPRSIRQSREYFLSGADGISMDQLATECGFTMSEILAAEPAQQE